jgi:hypothetical protein
MKSRLFRRHERSSDTDCVDFSDIEQIVEARRQTIENEKSELESQFPSVVDSMDDTQEHADKSIYLEGQSAELEIMSEGLRKLFESRRGQR